MKQILNEIVETTKQIKTFGNDIKIDSFGGKAYWLNWLKNQSYKVPESYFIPVNEMESGSYYNDLKTEIETLFPENTDIAVRSSGITEDGATASKAGEFKTFLKVPFIVDDIINKCKEIYTDSKNQNENTGIILQRFIESEYSGVIFSSNPVNLSKNEIVLNYQKGVCESLVSGVSEKFHEVIIDKRTKDLSEIPDEIRKQILELIDISNKIEGNLSKPVDIEWCIDKNTNELVIIQCRPQTSIFFEKNEVIKISQANLADNKRLNQLDKIKIRLEAEKQDVFISDAYIVNCNCVGNTIPKEISEISIPKSEYCKSYNIVVILPKLIDGKIVREFVGKKEDAIQKITCNRYNFRSCSKFENLTDAVRSIYNQLAPNYWACTMIIQEIFDPEYTGIIKRSGDKTIVEIAKGHFVAKGNVPMSTYILSDDGECICKENIQYSFYRIIEGQIIKQDFITPQKIHIPGDLLEYIVETFEPLFDEGSKNLEFGLLKYEENEYEPYLIDYTDEKEENIQISDLNKGIISHGAISGKIIRLASEDDNTIINSHCKNSEALNTEFSDDEALIFYCNTPNISLKKYLGKKNIGFIFDSAPLLCHLSILLRENNIPAIIKPEGVCVEESVQYLLDTSSNNLLIRS